VEERTERGRGGRGGSGAVEGRAGRGRPGRVGVRWWRDAGISPAGDAGGRRWPTPVAVYGYNSSWLVAGGYLHEAQTRCLDSRNMGAVASEANNLSFFETRAAPIRASGVVRPNAPESVTYDPARTYVALVVGDGDNIAYALSTRGD